MKIKFFTLSLFLVWLIQTTPATSLCPDPAPRIQSLLTRCDLGFVGLVIKERDVLEKDGGEDFVTGIYFTLKVEKTFHGPEKDFVEVYEDLDSGRLGLEKGHKYLLFVNNNEHGILQAYCGDGFDENDKEYKKSIGEAEKVLKNIKLGTNGDIRGFVGGSQSSENDPIPSIHFTISGNGKTYTVVSDQKGWFRLSVPPGHYKIKPTEAKWNVRLTDYCWEDPNNLDVRVAGGVDLGFVANQ